MARRRREIPTFFSFEIGSLRGLAESMTDEEWGRWSKNALNDLSIGCVKKNTDPRVKKMFEIAKNGMEEEYKRKREWYEKNKAETTTEQANELKDSSSPNQCNKQHTQPTPQKPKSRPATEPPQAPPQEPFYDFSTPAKDGPGFSLNGKSFDIAKVAKTATSKNGNGDVMNFAYSGEFQNVKLTQDQYNELCIKFANMSALNRAIDSLSSKLENGELQPVPKNHYAVLVKWAAYRDDKREEKDEDAERNRYETVSQHNMRILKQANEFVMNGGMEKLKNGTY